MDGEGREAKSRGRRTGGELEIKGAVSGRMHKEGTKGTEQTQTRQMSQEGSSTKLRECSLHLLDQIKMAISGCPRSWTLLLGCYIEKFCFWKSKSSPDMLQWRKE